MEEIIPIPYLEDRDIDELQDIMKSACVILERTAPSHQELEDLAHEADCSVAMYVAVLVAAAKRKHDGETN
jgi:hypothetical protein